MPGSFFNQSMLFLHVSSVLGVCRGMCVRLHTSYTKASVVYVILLGLLHPSFFNEKEYYRIYVKKIYSGMK